MAYQLIPKDGILPFKRSPTPHPLGFTLKCGNGICGQEILKLKNPLIASIIPLTVFLAVVNGDVIAVLIPFHTVVAIDLIPLKTDEILYLMPLKLPSTLNLIPLANE